MAFAVALALALALTLALAFTLAMAQWHAARRLSRRIKKGASFSFLENLDPD